LTVPSAREVEIGLPARYRWPQSLDIDLHVVERGERWRLEGAQATHDLLDVVHAHGKMEPVEDALHGAVRGRALQGRQRGVAVADRSYRLAKRGAGIERWF